MAEDVGVYTGIYRTVDPHYTFFIDAGVATVKYSAPSAAEVHVLPTQTGPVTGLYDPEWTALMSIEA